jgi:hypothetical protein
MIPVRQANSTHAINIHFHRILLDILFLLDASHAKGRNACPAGASIHGMATGNRSPRSTGDADVLLTH